MQQHANCSEADQTLASSFSRDSYVIGENMNQEKLAKLQAQVRIGGKVSENLVVLTMDVR